MFDEFRNALSELQINSESSANSEADIKDFFNHVQLSQLSAGSQMSGQPVAMPGMSANNTGAFGKVSIVQLINTIKKLCSSKPHHKLILIV